MTALRHALDVASHDPLVRFGFYLLLGYACVCFIRGCR